MVRASTAGMIDLSRFDPWDMWWWKKLRWTLDELELKQNKEVYQAQHTHWVTMASHGNLTTEAFDRAKANAGMAFNRMLKATYPWLAKEIGEEGTQTEREDAVDAYQQRFGKPGEPRYEAMVDTLSKAMAKKMTPRQKELDRKRRRAAREQAQREVAG